MNNCHPRKGNLHKEILKHDDSWYCYCTKKENTNSYRILNTFNQKVDAKFCWIMAQLKNCQCLCQTHDDDDDALIILGFYTTRKWNSVEENKLHLYKAKVNFFANFIVYYKDIKFYE